MKLKGKIIVITGGTSGIGLKMVEALVRENQVIVISKSQEKLDNLKKQFSKIETRTCDLSNINEVEKTADEIVKKLPKIDVVINNAAVQFTPKFIDSDFRYETIRKEITINFTAICTLIYLLLPSLISEESESVILNVNSGLGLAPKTNSAIYCGTKGGLYIFTQSLKYQLESTNIKVLQALLPLVDTSMTEGRGSGKLTATDAAKAIISGIERDIAENYIGLVKLLAFLMRLAPGVARKILKRG